MKKTLLTLQLLLASAAIIPLTGYAAPTFSPTVAAAADSPISQAEEFTSGSAVNSTADGEYKWYKYKAKTTKAYKLKIGYNSKAKLKITTDANVDVSTLADVELTKDQQLWAQVTPSYIVNAGEYLYFAVSTTSLTPITVLEEEVAFTYNFGEAAITPANGSVINSFSEVVIAYPDAATNNPDAVIALNMNKNGEASTSGESMIPAQIYTGQLEAVHGQTPIGEAAINLVTNGDGQPELQLTSEQPVEPGTWYTIQIPENVLSFCTEMFYPGSGILVSVPNIPSTTGMLLHYRGKLSKLSSTGVGIAANDTIGLLGMIPFGFDAEVKVAEGAGLELRAADEVVKRASLNVMNTASGCLVVGNFTDENLAPYALKDSTAYTLVLPANSVTTLDGTLNNEEISVSFSGPVRLADTVTVEVPTPVEAEMLNFTYIIGDQLVTKTATPKEKALTVEIKPEEGWKVEALTLDEYNVLPDLHGTTYQSPVLYKDATLTATFAYDGVVFEEDPMTGIAQADDTSIIAYSQDGKIIVEGLNPNEVVKVYSVGGSLLNQTSVANGRVSITLPTNQVYIVKAGNYALKLTNK